MKFFLIILLIIGFLMIQQSSTQHEVPEHMCDTCDIICYEGGAGECQECVDKHCMEQYPDYKKQKKTAKGTKDGPVVICAFCEEICHKGDEDKCKACSEKNCLYPHPEFQ